MARLRNITLKGFKTYAKANSKSTRLPCNLGDLNAIVGPNGSGKSTLFEAIMFVLSQSEPDEGHNLPDSGSISVELEFDNDDASFPYETDIVYVRKCIQRSNQDIMHVDGLQIGRSSGIQATDL